MATAQDPIATPTAAPTEAGPRESVQPLSGSMVSADDAEDTAQADASTKSAGGTKASVVSRPVELFPVAALGLLVAGFLLRIAIRIVAARRRRIIVDRPKSHWMDDRNEHELRDEHQHAGSVHQREKLIDDFVDRPKSHWMDDRNEPDLRDGQQRSGSARQRDKLIDDLQRSLIPTASDYAPRRAFRNDYESQENPQRRDRDSDIADESSRDDETLEQLRRALDRLLASPKVA